MLELKHTILRFGYGVNFRYEGMLSHPFDRFYIVTNRNILGIGFDFNIVSI